MSLPQPAFLGELHAAAVAAQKDEIEFRNSVAAQIARRERERQFAFRRVEIARGMLSAASVAGTREQAVQRQIAALKAELGWHSDTGLRPRIYEAWTPVAEAVWLSLKAEAKEGGETSPEVSVQAAMRTFEAWYEAQIGAPFLALLDHEIPEMPVVEF